MATGLVEVQPPAGWAFCTCMTCGRVWQHPINAPPAENGRCRCAAPLLDDRAIERSVRSSWRFAMLTLLLLVPAFFTPMLLVDPRVGDRFEACLVEVVIELFRYREVFIGTVILLASLVFVVLKVIFLLCATEWGHRLPIGHWLVQLVFKLTASGLIEVFVAGLYIVLLKPIDLVQVKPLAGIEVYTIMVACNLIATWKFDARIHRIKECKEQTQ